VLLARAGDAGQDDQSFGVVAQFFDGGREAQLLEGRDVRVDAPRHQAELAALFEHADAEAALIRSDDVRKIDTAFLVENAALPFAEEWQQKALHLLLGDRRRVHALDDALEAHHRRLADLEMEVGGLVLHDRTEQLVDLRLAAWLGPPPARAGRRSRRVEEGAEGEGPLLCCSFFISDIVG